MTSQKAPSRRPTRTSAEAEQKRALAQAVLQLPTDLRDVFLLNRMAGLSYEEIGKRLGIERAIVELYLAEALARIARAAPSGEA